MGFFNRKKKEVTEETKTEQINVEETKTEETNTQETGSQAAEANKDAGTLYYTEVGVPMDSWLMNQDADQITIEKYNDLIATLKKAEAIYCPFSLMTGEPYVYMDVLKDAEGYGFSKTRIAIWTEEENARLSEEYKVGNMEIMRITRGEDGEGIVNFLGMTFYENGVEFAHINGVKFPIAAVDILPKPDMNQIPENQRPIINPEIMRNQCLLSQLADHKNPMINDLDDMYMDRFSRALLSGRILLPIIVEGENQFSLPAWPGKDGREYLRVFTDWRRLYKGMDPEKKWSARVETVAGLINSYDVALNSNNSFQNLGIYINQALFERMRKNNR